MIGGRRERDFRMTNRWRILVALIALGALFAVSLSTTGVPAIIPVSFIVTGLIAWEFGVLASIIWVVIGHVVVPLGLSAAGGGPFILFPQATAILVVLLGWSALAEIALAFLIVRLRSLAHQLVSSREELVKANDELQAALDEVKELRGLLPICAWCKNIRDVTGNWEQFESYFARHSGVTFTHGLCPKCLEEKLREESAIQGDAT